MPLVVAVFIPVKMWKTEAKTVPKIVLKIELEKLPALYAARDVKTPKDLQRLFRDADLTVQKAMSVFPDVAEARVQRLTTK